MLARPNLPAGRQGHGEGEHHEGHRPSSIGPWVGAIIIIVVLGFGALYFYGEYLNKQNTQEQLPLIQGDISI